MTLKNEKGQGLIEYALILALVVIAAFAALQTIGGQTNNGYTKVSSSLTVLN